MEEVDCDYYFKLILLGVQAVGKTAIVQRYCYECFEDEGHKSTTGFDFLTKVLNYKGKKVQLQIWDTAGQERFRSVAKMYYQDVHGVLLIYDISSKTSLQKLQFWFDDLEMNGSKKEKRLLVGNKMDLEKGRQVRQIDGKKLATEQNMDWLECSAKTGEFVDDVFELLVDKLLEDQSDLSDPEDDFAVLPRAKPRLSRKSFRPHESSKKSKCC